MKAVSVDAMAISMDGINIKRHLTKCIHTLEVDEEWCGEKPRGWCSEKPREGEEVIRLLKVVDPQSRRLVHEHLNEAKSLHKSLGVVAPPLCEKQRSFNCKFIIEVPDTNHDACKIKKDYDPSIEDETKEDWLSFSLHA